MTQALGKPAKRVIPALATGRVVATRAAAIGSNPQASRRGGRPVGAYEDVFRASTEDPEGFWLEAAQAIDWDTAPTRALDASRPPFYRWFPDGELNTCHNALDRHVDAGRGDQAALIHDSPVTGTQRTLHLRPAARRGRPVRRRAARARASARATASSSTCRWSPRRRRDARAAPASAPCTRVVFGGFAAQRARRPDRRRQAVGHRLGLLRHRAQAGHRPTSRCSTRRSSWPRTSRASVVVLQRPQVEAEMGDRDVDWADAMARRDARPSASPSRPPTPSTSSTRPAPPGSRRASCATTAATRSR